MMAAELRTREKLPDRRCGVTEVLTYRKDEPNEVEFATTFNWEEGGRVREVFCLAFKEGTDMRTLLHHACIITSVALQCGATMHGLAKALAEEDPERKPASILALIIRAGVTIDEHRGFARPRQEISS
jgi:hypothetical protein